MSFLLMDLPTFKLSRIIRVEVKYIHFYVRSYVLVLASYLSCRHFLHNFVSYTVLHPLSTGKMTPFTPAEESDAR
jgi:hypothetical protein